MAATRKKPATRRPARSVHPVPAQEMPIGSIIMWGGEGNVPPGWLVCDGSHYKKTQYKALWAVVGHYFGDPTKAPGYDPSTDFYVPDLRGRFVRGVDSASDKTGRDPDRDARQDMQSGKVIGPQVGSVQPDMFASHSHGYDKFPGNSGNIASGEYWQSMGAQTASSGGNETRPKNAYLYFIIKAL